MLSYTEGVKHKIYVAFSLLNTSIPTHFVGNYRSRKSEFVEVIDRHHRKWFCFGIVCRGGFDFYGKIAQPDG